jgi:uncharacterized protein GlcG (DUF336 family)
MNNKIRFAITLMAAASTSFSVSASERSCKDLPSNVELRKVLLQVKNDPAGNGGVNVLGLWATIMDTTGTVCAVVSTEEGDLSVNAELAHRIFSAQKANTANAFSNSKAATASGQLYTQALPGGTLYNANLNSRVEMNSGDPSRFGTVRDPMVGKRVGGFNAWGGGLALYDSNKNKVGALGVSGQSRCSDHLIAWKVRNTLANGAYIWTNVPFGFSSAGTDALVLDVIPDPTGSGGPGHSPSGLGHPSSFCPNLPTPEQAGPAFVYH